MTRSLTPSATREPRWRPNRNPVSMPILLADVALHGIDFLAKLRRELKRDGEQALTPIAVGHLDVSIHVNGKLPQANAKGIAAAGDERRGSGEVNRDWLGGIAGQRHSSGQFLNDWTPVLGVGRSNTGHFLSHPQDALIVSWPSSLIRCDTL